MRMHTVGAIAFSATLLAAQVAVAQEEMEPGVSPRAEAAPPAEERVRIQLGMALAIPGVGGVAGGNAGAVGAIGGYGFGPLPQAAIGIHVAGPAWFVVGGHFGYHETRVEGSDGSFDGQSVDGGGELGVRLEAPTFDWLELGGNLMLEASYAGTSGDHGEYESIRFGGVAGVGAHLRPTRFFGIRMGLTLLRAGRAWQPAGAEGTSASSTYAELVAWPSAELTFTF
jgi:hypothetical protein